MNVTVIINLLFMSGYTQKGYTQTVICNWFLGPTLFLVPVKGGRDYITSQKARTISGIFPANWVIIYYLPTLYRNLKNPSIFKG